MLCNHDTSFLQTLRDACRRDVPIMISQLMIFVELIVAGFESHYFKIQASSFMPAHWARGIRALEEWKLLYSMLSGAYHPYNQCRISRPLQASRRTKVLQQCCTERCHYPGHLHVKCQGQRHTRQSLTPPKSSTYWPTFQNRPRQSF